MRIISKNKSWLSTNEIKKPMKILTLNTFDLAGGAARAANRLHTGLIAQGIDAQMLVQHKHSDEPTIIGPENRIQKALGIIRPVLDTAPLLRHPDRSKTLFSPSWLSSRNILSRINHLKPDLVHLHWVANGMMSIEDIAKIQCPVIWSLHDMWPFTGGCHYDSNCGGFKNSCGKCPILGSKKDNDLSSRILKRKQTSFSRVPDLTIVGLSKWIATAARESSVFKETPVVHLPNAIATKIFSPIDKQQARSLFDLPQKKKLVLFGAMSATSDPRKGFIELEQALENLDSENVELVVFGSSRATHSYKSKIKVHYIGQLNDDLSLRVLYNAADVMVVPSLQENLSNAILEALSCSTPVVGFDIGGNSDLIEHKINGYLAKNIEDLTLGIKWVLNEDVDSLRHNARTKVLQNFDSDVVTKRYMDLYESILLRKKRFVT